MTAGASRSRHFFRQIGLLASFGLLPRYAHPWKPDCGRRPLADTLDQLSLRRRRAQIAARRALHL